MRIMMDGDDISEWPSPKIYKKGTPELVIRLLRLEGMVALVVWAQHPHRVTKRCKTLSGHNVVEGKDFKNTA